MSADGWYFDSSAIVKLILAETESAAVRSWAASQRYLITCDLARVEVPRAVRSVAAAGVAEVLNALLPFEFVTLDQAVYERAATIEPLSLRTLDAIHIAAALTLGPDLAGIVTYDRRMAAAARSLGITVETPGATAGA